MKYCQKLLICLCTLILIFICSAESVYTGTYREGSYNAYISAYESTDRPLANIEVIPETQLTEEVGGRKAYVLDGDGESARWDFLVSETGSYRMSITYYALEGSGNVLEYCLFLDGEVPFAEAGQLQLTRLYCDTEKVFRQDSMGNDLRPHQEEIHIWQTADLMDTDGYNNGCYLFYLTEGKHTLTLRPLRDPAAMCSIRFYNEPEVTDYYNYRNALACLEAGSGSAIIEAEHPETKSSTQLYPVSDRSDPATTPSDPVAKKLNAIGGENWNNAGQSVTWKFDVEKDGLYTLSFRYLQSYLRGMMVYRRILIDEKVPFDELGEIAFPYGLAWQTLTVGCGEPYGIYLTEGTHTLTLVPTTGPLAEIMSRVDAIVNDLNALYRKIIMVTGTSPDLYRDYFLEESIPGMIDEMNALASGLREVEQMVMDMTGYSGTEAAALLRLAEELESFVKRPGTIPGRLGTFRDNIVTISSWTVTISQQSLELDRIYIVPVGEEIPENEAGFTDKAAYQAKALIGSFVTDYELIGSAADSDKSISVWVSSGRDQAEVLKELIDADFTPQTGIGVNLCIVQSGLMQAMMAGEGPDAVIMLGRGDPVNYALRGAVLPLETFAGFDELAAQYMPSALVPFEWNGHCWGLPNSQDFYMMFYRKDIFDELGITVPETWDDLLVAAETLQRNNMSIGLPYTSLDAYASVSTGVGGTTLFPTLLLQSGTGLYTEDKQTTTLNTPEALQAFKQWTAYYTQYGFPLYKDDFSRFRSGEMPLIITSYTFYSKLKVAAPDIRNLWNMALIPGTVKQNGSVDHSTAAFGTAGMILSTTQQPDEAWEFLKWWNDKQTQIDYGRQVENVLGPSGRYNPANVEAMKGMLWSGEELGLIMEQWSYVQELPELPGSYYVSRNIDNAFKEVYYDKENCRETLNYWTREINNELERKRNEFNGR